MKRHLVRVLLGLAVAVLFLGHVVQAYQIPTLNSLDSALYDLRLRLSLTGGVDQRIAIVDLDEKSLAEFGRWPWSRDKMANLVKQLFARYQISLLGFDIVFAEADHSSGLRSLENLGRTVFSHDQAFQSELKKLRQTLDYDQSFAQTLRPGSVVLGYYFTEPNAANTARRSGVLPAATLDPKQATMQQKSSFMRWYGYGGNLAEYQKNAVNAGHFNIIPDADGVTRKVPMLAEYEGKYYASLSLAMLRTLLGNPPLSVLYAPTASHQKQANKLPEWLALTTDRGVIRIPIDANGNSLIPYRGAQGSFHYYSAADVLTGRLAPERLRGKIVLLGTSAPGLSDLRTTPLGNAYPGVEIHANLIAGMLDGTIKQQAPYMLGAEALLLLLCTLTLAIVLPMLSPTRASLLSLGIVCAVLLLNAGFWWANQVLPLASTLSAIFVLYMLNMLLGYFVETRKKRHVTELFGQYVPPELVDEMVLNPKQYSMHGQSAELTVIFVDVVNFSRLSEGCAPNELANMMNRYFGVMTQILRQHHGTLDKYIGDALMGFWGAPVSNPGHAADAIRAALAMQAALSKLAQEFAARQWPALQIRIGINTGTMTVGDMGSALRKAYTVMGDSVNLAARLEKITRYYGVCIIVGEACANAAPAFVYRELDWVRVKGKDIAVRIFEPLCLREECPQALLDELSLWHRMLRFYRAQEWEQADLQLYQLTRMNQNCLLYQHYVERIARYRATPPSGDWDAVTDLNVQATS